MDSLLDNKTFYLNDYVKIDIEGDEYKVLKEQDKNLANSLFDSIYQ